MSLEVSSMESLSLMITGDSRSPFRNTYLRPEGRGLSSMGGFVGGSDSLSSIGSSKLSSSWMKSKAIFFMKQRTVVQGEMIRITLNEVSASLSHSLLMTDVSFLTVSFRWSGE